MRDGIAVKDLSFAFGRDGGKTVFSHLDLEFAKGKVHLIMGPSGCGKSTFASLVSSLYGDIFQKKSGKILVDGLEVDTLSVRERTRHVTMMNQNPDLQFCSLTLHEELIFCLENIGYPVALREEKIHSSVNALGLEELLDRPFVNLSGGEKQKAGLCCTLALSSSVIVLDEILANLDKVSALAVVSLLGVYHKNNPDTTFLIIDHRFDRYVGLADTITLFDVQGLAIIKSHPLAKIAEIASIFESNGLFYPHQIVPKTAKEGGDILLKGENIHIVRDGKELLSGAGIAFRKGTITAILGPSGCGKTSFLLALMKELRYQGSLVLEGKEIRKMRRRKLFSRLGIVFQNPQNQFLSFTVLDEVLSGMKDKDPVKGNDLLMHYGLSDSKSSSPYLLSQGQQRRLAVLSVLAEEKEILLLDEPTYGQDYRSTVGIMEMLSALSSAGLTIIMNTHDEELSAEYADVIYRIKDRGFVHETA